jgi:Mlc titration factor MtfA (ptsG expression regulator)
LRIIERNVPLYRELPTLDQRELLEHILVFLAEKSFEGCAGLVITDEIRVTIAAQACILLLHRKTHYYPGLDAILVYPHVYVAKHYERDAVGVVTEELRTRLGESWRDGAVVLAWDGVRAGAGDLRDGHNVVFHEFAHQLDSENGHANGGPVLPRRSMYIAWARVLGREYERLRRDAEYGHATVLDQYGATNPAEFFAVATESFFTAPHLLKARHPELYGELQLYYRQDPAGWGRGDARR